jgi:hypothetical protein
MKKTMSRKQWKQSRTNKQPKQKPKQKNKQTKRGSTMNKMKNTNCENVVNLQNIENLTDEGKAIYDDVAKSLVNKSVKGQKENLGSVKGDLNNNIPYEEWLSHKKFIDNKWKIEEKVEECEKEYEMMQNELILIIKRHENASNKCNTLRNKPKERKPLEINMANLKTQMEKLASKMEGTITKAKLYDGMRIDAQIYSNEKQLRWNSEDKVNFDNFIVKGIKDENSIMKNNINLKMYRSVYGEKRRQQQIKFMETN